MERGEWIESVANSTASGSDLAILYIIATSVTADGAVRFRQSQLAGLANIGPRAVRSSIARLVAAGELIAIRGTGKTPSEFRLVDVRDRADADDRSERTLTSAQGGRSRPGSLTSAPTYGGNSEPTHISDRTRADADVRSSAQPVTGYMVKEPVVSQNQAGVLVSDSPRLFCADVLELHPKTAAIVCRKLAHYTDLEALGLLKLWRLYAIVQVQRGKVTRSTSGYVASAIRCGWSLPDWFAEEISEAADPAIRELGRYL